MSLSAKTGLARFKKKDLLKIIYKKQNLNALQKKNIVNVFESVEIPFYKSGDFGTAWYDYGVTWGDFGISDVTSVLRGATSVRRLRHGKERRSHKDSNIGQSRESNLGPCGWKAEILYQLRQPRLPNIY